MKDFNKQLQELIKEANKSGYEYKNGKFKLTDEGKFPVMEVFLIDETTCESTGYWNIYKKTVKISDEEYKKVLEYAKENEHEDINDDNENEDFYEKFFDVIMGDIVGKYDDNSNIDFYIGYGNIQICYEEEFSYHDHEGYTECVDLWFTKKIEDGRFPRGYISFYEMPLSDFKKAESVDLDITKYMRWN